MVSPASSTSSSSSLICEPGGERNARWRAAPVREETTQARGGTLPAHTHGKTEDERGACGHQGRPGRDGGQRTASCQCLHTRSAGAPIACVWPRLVFGPGAGSLSHQKGTHPMKGSIKKHTARDGTVRYRVTYDL